jgi:hypothetical protein
MRLTCITSHNNNFTPREIGRREGSGKKKYPDLLSPGIPTDQLAYLPIYFFFFIAAIFLTISSPPLKVSSNPYTGFYVDQAAVKPHLRRIGVLNNTTGPNSQKEVSVVLVSFLRFLPNAVGLFLDGSDLSRHLGCS